MKNNTTTLDEFKDKYFGKPETASRDELENGYKEFKTTAFKQDIGLAKGVVGEITKEQLLKFVTGHQLELSSTHQKLCIPIINRIYRKMLIGIKFAEIKVSNSCICDGHHRYLASLLAKYPIGMIPYVNTLATTVIDWESVCFEENDWDTPERIQMLNETDASYNSILLEELVELLK